MIAATTISGARIWPRTQEEEEKEEEGRAVESRICLFLKIGF